MYYFLQKDRLLLQGLEEFQFVHSLTQMMFFRGTIVRQDRLYSHF